MVLSMLWRKDYYNGEVDMIVKEFRHGKTYAVVEKEDNVYVVKHCYDLSLSANRHTLISWRPYKTLNVWSQSSMLGLWSLVQL